MPIFLCALYFSIVLGLNILVAIAPWGSLYISLIIVVTYFFFRPKIVFHPNNMIFAFYGLYVVLASSIGAILDAISWEYVLPWGQLVYWDTLSRYTLFQAEFTFLVLYFSFHYFSSAVERSGDLKETIVEIDTKFLVILYVFTACLVLRFIQVTGGIQAWVYDYSYTYLTRREGHGLLNVLIIAFGNIVVFLLGLRAYFSEKKTGIVIVALMIMGALSYINGVKSRFVFLLIAFLSPYLMNITFRLKYLILFGVCFFILLYVGTLIRTEGFYASAPFFLEMLLGYFNSFQLHDYVVTSRDPALFQTIAQIFTKPLQIFGMADADADFDISVMLTKEFFPEQWFNEHATQQWPLDTELYLNYYGFYFSWIPLMLYAFIVSKLYRSAILNRNLYLVPIFLMEFQRIFSTMRGTIIPWEIFIYVAQYLLIYACCKFVIKVSDVAAS